MKRLWQRSLSGLLFGIVVIGCIMTGPIGLGLLVLAIQIFGGREWYHLASNEKHSTFSLMGVTIGIIGLTGLLLVLEDIVPVQTLLVLFPLIALTFIPNLIVQVEDPFREMGSIAFGWFYVTAPLGFLLLTAYQGGAYDPYVTLLPFILIWINDTGAYLIGSFLGRNTLYEKLSPNKTWEGTVAGILLAAVTGGLFSNFLSNLGLYEGVILGLLMGIAGIFGDLLESLFKRKKGVKDSGELIPGHGGVLDRFDAFLLAMPFVGSYAWLVM